MHKDKITVLFNPRKITLMYTMYPFWASRYKSRFSITPSIEWVQRKDTNKILIIAGLFHGHENDEKDLMLMEVLRKKYECIVYIDDSAGAVCHHFDLIRYFDIYYKKHIFSDLCKYFNTFYGKRIYTDYYHKSMGVIEEPQPVGLPELKDPGQLDKMRLGWNLALGQYPASPIKTRIARHLYKLIGAQGMGVIRSRFPEADSPPVPSISKCQARFGYKSYRPTIGYQRKLFLEIIEGKPEFLTGVIPRSQYLSEIKNVQAVLSPFGWGEVCFRDFEAILSGSILIKPDMSHLRTWPDLYRDGETCIAVRWDGADLVEKVTAILNDPERMAFIRSRAWNVLKEAYVRTDTRIEAMLEEISGIRRAAFVSTGAVG